MKKVCSKCGESYPDTLEFFYANKRSKDGLEYWCRQCRNKASKESRLKNPKKTRAFNRKWNAIKSIEVKSPRKDFKTGKKCICCGGDLMGNYKRCPTCVSRETPLPEKKPKVLYQGEISYIINSMELLY